MYIIRPTTITEAMLHSTNIPENDYTEWNVSTAYSEDDYCMVAAQHKIYQALTAVTGGSSPEIDVLATVPKWIEVSATNRWKAFDAVIGTQSANTNTLAWVLNPGTIDAISVQNMDASSMQIICADQNQDIITNGTAWTGATGTTPPTGWNTIITNNATSRTPTYSSDFSAGVDGWSGSAGTINGNIDSIGGEDNWLRYYASSENNFHYCYINNKLMYGKSAIVTGKVFIPNTGGATYLDGVRICAAAAPQIATTYADITAVGSMQTFSVILTSTNTYNALSFAARKGGVYSFAGANSSTDDLFYIKDIVVTELGADFLIDSGTIKITAYAAGEGMSQAVTVVPGTEYQLLGIYKNTAGDIAQYAVYDVTHGADILATTDLASSTVDSTLSYVFTAPAGCTSVKISLLAKSSGDIIWFDTVSVAPTTFNETENLISTINVVDAYTYCFEPIVTKRGVNFAYVPPYATASVTIIISTTGTAKCGLIVMGRIMDIGTLQYEPQPGYVSNSTIDKDTFGNYTITKRDGAKKMSGQVHLQNAYLDYVLQQIASYDGEFIVFVGHDDYECLTIYGLCTSFAPNIKYPDFTVMDIDIEGVI